MSNQHDGQHDGQHDPLDVLAEPIRPMRPSREFALALRARLVDALGLDDTSANTTIELPERKSTMSTSTSASRSTSTTGSAVVTAVAVPYLAVRGGVAALDWYAEAFGAVEAMRVVGDDGRIGHAEISIGGATFYLSDEYPEIGVDSPASAGATTVTIHLTVDEVDTLFARAVAAGATSLSEPADQPHGARHGSLSDPFGHRWMLSQQIEQVDLDTYRERAAAGGFTVEAGTPTTAPKYGQIWAAMPYADAPAGIRFLTEVLGFEAQLVVPSADDPDVIEHSQLRWPEGGILQASTANRPGNPYSARPVGSESLYVVTANPEAVWERCAAAGVEVLDPPSSPDYAPDTMNFSIRDPEGNIFTFGSYAGEA